jgi:hypothetical protein
MYSGVTTFLGSGLAQRTIYHLLPRQPYQTRDKVSEHQEPEVRLICYGYRLPWLMCCDVTPQLPYEWFLTLRCGKLFHCVVIIDYGDCN